MTAKTCSPEVVAAYERLICGRGHVVLPQRTLLEFRGAERNRFLHKFCTADVNAMSDGSVAEAFILDQRGRTIGFGHLIRLADRTLFTMPSANVQASLRQHFERYVIREDVRIEDISNEFAAIHIAAAVAEQGCPEIAGVCTGTATFANIESVETLIAQADFAGKGFLVTCPRQNLESLTAALANRGIPPCPLDALHMHRIESGTPWFGLEIDDTNLPQEIRRDATAISFNKGCYLGQETVAKIDAIGHVNRFLVGITIEGGDGIGADTPIHIGQDAAVDRGADDGKNIGTLRSIAWSPRLQSWLGMALVKRIGSQPGTAVTIGTTPATIVELPLKSR